MTRKRNPGDPDRWPVPCARCGEHCELVARWPDGTICAYCYRLAKRTKGTCSCGHTGVLPGRIDDQPACRTCSGIQVNLDCRNCGAEDALHSRGRCYRCTLSDTVDQLLTNPQTGRITACLAPLANGLKTMAEPTSGLTWIKQKHVKDYLVLLAAHDVITHELLDQLPGKQLSRNYIRGLLVEHGTLPPRDELQARYIDWASTAIDRVIAPEHREIIQRYVTWHHKRRMRQTTTTSHGMFLRAKQSVTVAIDLLNWLTEHQVVLADLDQAHLEGWRAQGTGTCDHAASFVLWAKRTHLIRSDLTMPIHRAGPAPRLSAGEQDEAIHRVVFTNELSTRNRAAAILVIVFAQRVEHIIKLSWDDAEITNATVTVRVGQARIVLPDPLDQPFRELATARSSNTAAHPNTKWMFPGFTPGRHIQASSLREQLQHVFGPQAARLGTLHELTKLTPIAIIAETLGYATKTIEQHARASGTAYAQYIANRHIMTSA